MTVALRKNISMTAGNFLVEYGTLGRSSFGECQMGFADRYITALGASNLKDDELHHQAEPLLASALASAALTGDLGPALHRIKYASTAPQNMAHTAAVRTRLEGVLAQAIAEKDTSREASCRQALEQDATALTQGIADLAQLLRLWTAEVMKRGRARRWVPENTAWDADAAQKLYRAVAEHSLAYWLDGKCRPCGGTGVQMKMTCRTCSGTGNAELTMAAGFVRKHTLDMVSELHNIADSHGARAMSKLRSFA